LCLRLWAGGGGLPVPRQPFLHFSLAELLREKGRVPLE